MARRRVMISSPRSRSRIKAVSVSSKVKRPAGKRQWRSKLDHDGHAIPVLVIEEASHGFISIWLDSPHTPWVDDKECAREVFVALGCPVRATAGSWHEGDDPDLWWEINQTGEHELHWPG